MYLSVDINFFVVPLTNSKVNNWGLSTSRIIANTCEKIKSVCTEPLMLKQQPRTLRLFLVREQGWRSGESTSLPQIWPGFKSQRRCHILVEFVVGFLPCSERFFSKQIETPLCTLSIYKLAIIEMINTINGVEKYKMLMGWIMLGLTLTETHTIKLCNLHHSVEDSWRWCMSQDLFL